MILLHRYLIPGCGWHGRTGACPQRKSSPRGATNPPPQRAARAVEREYCDFESSRQVFSLERLPVLSDTDLRLVQL